MSFTAYFQANEELRYTIGTAKMRHTAEFACENLIKRMTHPEVGIWWVWVEETDDPDEAAKRNS